MVGHEVTTVNLQWNTVLGNFEIQWKVKEGRPTSSPQDLQGTFYY